MNDGLNYACPRELHINFHSSEQYMELLCVFTNAISFPKPCVSVVTDLKFGHVVILFLLCYMELKERCHFI